MMTIESLQEHYKAKILEDLNAVVGKHLTDKEKITVQNLMHMAFGLGIEAALRSDLTNEARHRLQEDVQRVESSWRCY
jgi:hypothetical protein